MSIAQRRQTWAFSNGKPLGLQWFAAERPLLCHYRVRVLSVGPVCRRLAPHLGLNSHSLVVIPWPPGSSALPVHVLAHLQALVRWLATFGLFGRRFSNSPRSTAALSSGTQLLANGDLGTDRSRHELAERVCPCDREPS